VTDTVGSDPAGEVLSVPERLVVSPAIGAFRPDPAASTGRVVDAGQPVGTVETARAPVAVRSPFTGPIMGLLAVDGERVRPGQPVAWLRTL
jgi:biotin carboxyl carrier protein